MTYKITYTKGFAKHYKRMSAFEKKQIRAKVDMLSKDPLHPSLRTKKIKGGDGLFECSVNMDIRIIWCYENNTLILLLDVGHHDVLDHV